MGSIPVPQVAVKIRKNQKSLSAQEWQDFIDAVSAAHALSAPQPRFQEFVNVHVAAMDMANMDWAVHTMGLNMPGTNFLAWHRKLLSIFEDRLRQTNPTIAMPYWDWRNDPDIPAALTDEALLNSWGVIRRWKPAKMPSVASIDAVLEETTYSGFQTQLESGPHNAVHRAVGGNMAQANSPSDPIFYLHHANIDRIWSAWQKSPNGEQPPNMAEILQPKNNFPGSAIVFNIPVSSVVSITDLNYAYE
jgi:Common central domain of tyrosinase